MKPTRWAHFLVGFEEPVGRRAYCGVGLALAALKLAIDSTAVHLVSGRWPTPWEALSPLLSTRSHALANGPEWVLGALLLVTLPFLWVGISMSVRRAIDAGMTPWTAMLFFVPVLNLAMIALLAAVPSRPRAGWIVLSPSPGEVAGWKSAVLGILLGVGLTWLMVGASVLLLGAYGAVLFLTTPFMIGAASAYLFNRGNPQSVLKTLAVVVLALAIAASSLLLVALEGVLCLLMALPMALFVGGLGGLMGRAIAMHDGRLQALVFALAVLPFLSGFDAALDPVRLRSVTTEVFIDAAPEEVWKSVVGFADIQEKPSLLFELGIAYPIRAVIQGEGKGAIRRCEFSTGAFVEPITTWDPPRHLAFDVLEAPAPMFEWSFYDKVHAPHLLSGLRSQRGEFRLSAVSGGTWLVGTTWYNLTVFPEAYWGLWSDVLIHSIHRRVLRHIKGQVELPHTDR